MIELLDGVSEVDWSTLEHAYGSARDVPGRLTAMTDPSTHADALDRLDSAVYHQGGAVYSAAVPVIPVLVRFAREPTVPGRAGILDLLRRFAALHHEMQEPFRSRPEARACRSVLLESFDSLLGLLDEPDEEVRRAALAVLVELTERAGDLGDVLMGRPDDEDFVLALGTTGAAGKRAVVLEWLAGHTPPPGDPRRLPFLVAARRLGPNAVTGSQIVAAYTDAGPERPVGWLGREVGGDRAARIALARVAIGQAVRTQQPEPLAEVGTVMRRWRSAPAELADDLATALDGPPAIHAAVVHLLAVTGDAGRRRADEVAALIGRPGRTGPFAVWALARWGDRRAVPAVERSLRGDAQIFDMGTSHYASDVYWLTQSPAIADVCLPLIAYADELVPAIRRRLRNDSTTPTAHHLTEILARYGTAASAALPELTAMLETEHFRLACRVLAGLGPAAGPAQAELRRLAASDAHAAWALFRITGDPEPLLTHPGEPDARLVGDLGPLAARHVPHIEQRLTGSPQHWPGWRSVDLAFAHFRITGDPALCLDVFDAALDPLRHGHQLPANRRALRCLAALGPAAARFAPLLRDAVARDERLLDSGGWRGITEDDEARDLAIRALAAVGQ